MVNWKFLGGGVFFAVALAAMGVGMYYAGYYDQPEADTKKRLDIFQMLQDEIKAANIDANLKHLSSVPHLAGTDQDLIQAEWVRDQFMAAGFDEAKVVPYEVLLSYPRKEQPNKVYLLNEAGGIEIETTGTQTPIYAPEESSPDAMPNFNAYSAPGTPEGELVYVYYGRDEDYDELTKLGIDVTGKIVLARYGKVFRGNIVATAENRGAIGVILYSDPQDFAQDGRSSVYADSWWMPGMAVQSGTVYLGNGDPLTPYYPAIESAYRIDVAKADLPKIPVQPIGYDEAERFLQAMDKTHPAPPNWNGTLDASYSPGPGFQNPGWKIKLEVHTSNKMATTYNTIGIIYGDEEPDRYVLVGNHRDAWILGSIDPSSGTASMLEMARAFGAIKRSQSWRPRRSLVFCSWGAEEYGLIGSYEWIEQHSKVLSQRAVAYLNVDIAVEGNYSLYATASPVLRTLLVESSKKVANPNPSEVAGGQRTMFDKWAASFPDSTLPNQPRVGTLGSGSDYTAFIHCFGIPSLDMRYTYEEDVGSYPLYHTLYETHHLSGNMIDPGFLYHRAVTQLWAEVARNLTESEVLPFDVQWYASYLGRAVNDLTARYTAQLTEAGATFNYVGTAMSKFSESSKDYVENKLTKVDFKNALAVRQVNDQLMQLERHFVDPRGLPNRPEYNHIVAAPSSSDTYASSSFSGLTDLLESVKGQPPGTNLQVWSQIQQHLSVIAFYIDAAAKSLSETL